jgi:adenylyl-sulfate kinase
MSKYALFIGRWQPFHNGHQHIIQQALDAGKKVAIACRKTPITESDPYTVEERIEMISNVYRGKPVIVIPIPDIESVNIGRKVGYDVVRYDAPDDIEGISATQIRSMMDNGDDSWKTKVPREIAKYIGAPNGEVIWLTGWSGAGKSTIAEKLAGMLEIDGRRVKLLDGDDVRTFLTSDLGFSREDRDENIKRISYAAKCIADVGGTAIVAAISPYAKAREDAKMAIGPDRFIEVFVKADLETLKERDPKGLYKKALAGKIKNFTGISDPYEDPENPDVVVDTATESVDESISKILSFIYVGKY